MAKIESNTLLKRINFNPHPTQMEVLNNLDKREIVINAGRRWGKSILAAYLTLGKFLGDNQRIWLVANTYDLTQKIFDYIVQWIAKAYPSLMPGVSTRIPQQIVAPWGSFIKCKSTENPQGLLGEELDLVIIDEAAQISRDIFNNYIFPCLTSREGKLILISSPWGKNWFYEEWIKCKNWELGASYSFKTSDNPYIKKSEIELAKQRLPLRVFQQQYEAAFLDNAAGVFRNVMEHISGDLEDVKEGHHYVVGVDLGKFHDFTVISVVDISNNHLVYFERFNKIDWKFQRERIKNVAKRYNMARIVIDSTGKGDPVVDELMSEGFLVEAYNISSNKAKRNLVEKLSIFLDRGQISYPPIEVLIDELESYTYQMTDSGNVKYSSPEGLHDDCVMSLALAVWNLSDVKILSPIKQRLLEAQRSEVKIKNYYI